MKIVVEYSKNETDSVKELIEVYNRKLGGKKEDGLRQKKGDLEMKIPYLSKWGKRFRFYRGIQLKKAAVLAILGITVIGTGYPPTGINGSQAKMMARRAAIVSCYKQLSEEGIHSGFRIVGENWDGGSYEVEMTY